MLKFLSGLYRKENVNPDHRGFLEGIRRQLDVASDDADLVTKELDLLTAAGEWLDEWGSRFGLSRIMGESDEKYRYRILTIMEDKVTIPAIIQGTKKELGDDTIISIYEPYNDLAFHNVTTYSGTGRYPDATYYRIGVIDVMINKPVTESLVRFIRSISPAGVIVRFTYVPTPDLDSIIIDGTSDPNVVSMRTSTKYRDSMDDIFVDPTIEFSNKGNYSGDFIIWDETKSEDV